MKNTIERSKNREQYVAPKIKKIELAMEHGIAAGSANLRSGTAGGNDDFPSTGSWSEKGDVGGGTNSFDF
ncbi:hypothetical protein BCY89_27635 [Sphingobacterium siyangense]|uniref:Uncharacterized protein n=1 Tax=Sphingobacterium siyangense TaxID=459529 RepID=A0A420FXJ9_9SPHI|nr:hypothetical protein [Sphingobacterium siyangense]RKF37653.1 hypothetical protein BCY89_27635 [Sphingobacterium siyangense]